MLIQIHMLQNYAPANLNRDDTGAPKTAVFGGKRRGRISSQCIKRSIRRSEAFQKAFKESGLLGTRTRRLPELIAEELGRLEADEEAIRAIVERVPEIGRESAKKGDEDEGADDEVEETATKEVETKQLIFIAPNELPVLAASLLEIYRKLGASKWKKAKIDEIAKELKTELPRSVDIAMFGRMTTSAAFEDVNAAVQVAHAISTNTLEQEFDYYTAVDDISRETGAGMIGDVAYNSSTYYKYLNVHWESLVNNLGGDTATACAAVIALLEAAATAHPSGKQNSFAAFNLPDFILVEVSQRNLPVNHANAFLKPVRESYDIDLMTASIQALAGYIEKVSGRYNLNPERAYLAMDEVTLSGAEPVSSLVDLKEWLAERLPVEG